MKLSIVIPAYNEEKRIGKTLEEFNNFYEDLRKTKKLEDYQIIILINNTKDRTEDVVKTYSKKNKRIVISERTRGGKGYAVVEGFKEALKQKNDLIGFVDADLATPPREFWRLAEEMDVYDGAIANRYMPGSKIVPAFSIRRTIVSRVFNFLVRTAFLLPYTDTQCGAKLFTRKTMEKIIRDLTITQWAFDIDLLYACKKRNLRIKSIKTEWEEMEGSTIDINKSSIQMLFAIIQLRLLRSPFKKSLRVIAPIIGTIYKLIK